MPDLSGFPVTLKWPPQHPDRIQYYGLPTPNGVKVSIMLEETGLPYEAHKVDFSKDEQKSPEFLSLNPNGKIPAILDPNGPGNKPIGMFESGAILLYLAGKAGKFLPNNPVGRLDAIQWLMFQMGGVGPMFGQLGFYVKFAGKDWGEDKSRGRYAAETKRLLGVMDAQLAGKTWFLGDDYSIVDISLIGVTRNLVEFYGAGELVGFDEFGNVKAWLERALVRPAVQRGLAVAG
ncbi:MAG: glutathione S-transferase N-terminal domain-containing protein [Pseudomonadota bacterium]